jgi:hypothetical protein
VWHFLTAKESAAKLMVRYEGAKETKVFSYSLFPFFFRSLHISREYLFLRFLCLPDARNSGGRILRALCG